MSQDNEITPDELAARLVATPDAAQRQALLAAVIGQPGGLGLALVEALKARVDAELLRDAGQALHLAGICAEAAAHLADPLAEPLALWARGNALLYLGRYRECLDHYARARAAYTQHGQALEVARLLVNEVFALQDMGQYDNALRAANEARELLADAGPTRYKTALAGCRRERLSTFPKARSFREGKRDMSSLRQAPRGQYWRRVLSSRQL